MTRDKQKEPDPVKATFNLSQKQAHNVIYDARSVFFKTKHEAQLLMKSIFREGKFAIKNSAGEDPEGYSTILDAPMCNGGLVP